MNVLLCDLKLDVIFTFVLICRLGYIFWINNLFNNIKRAHLNGTNVTLIAAGNIGSPGKPTYICMYSDSIIHCGY